MDPRYSHPADAGHGRVQLEEHLDDTAERVSHIVPGDAQTPAGESLRNVVETLAYLHDFGKATTYFQQYIGEMAGEPDCPEYRYHAPIGAFASYYALDAQGYDTETCLAGFVAVGKHHGELPDIARYVFRRAYRREGVPPREQNSAEQLQMAVSTQMEDIDRHWADEAGTLFEDATAENGAWREFYDGFGTLLDEIASTVATTSGEGITREALSESCYALVLECWGSLILADKTSAASGSEAKSVSEQAYRPDRPSLKQLERAVTEIEDRVDASPDGTRTERLNHNRSNARRDVLEGARAFAAEGGGVATLTLPTGMGKTLSGLSAALTVRDHLGSDRVVYALPFTSIIDQVVDEVRDIYQADTTGRLLTAHHHLSETTTTLRGDDELDGESDADKDGLNDDIAGMLAESWRAGLTVTTFVQLFESLAGPANRQSMKLPALRDSVVVLDEPQSLPLDWWQLVPRLVRLLTERYDATVIAMTATQPRLFKDATELVDEPDRYFDAAERVAYTLDVSTERYIDDQVGPKSYDAAAETLLDDVEPGTSALAVCNTIDSARTLTDHITDRRAKATGVGTIYAEELAAGGLNNLHTNDVADRVQAAGDVALLHLSTRMRPVDRLHLIDVAKELTDRGHTLIAVSTQLIEAGVDISFDRVYRDLAPIDSIVQAAGRCNRSFERDRGEVTIWWLDTPADQTKTPAEAVYNRGPVLLPVAADTLASVRGNQERIAETDVARNAVDRYYETLHEQKNVGNQEYVTYVDEGRADELSNLSLIDERRAVDVIICRTEADRMLIDSVEQAFDEYDFETVNTLMNDLRTKQISIPIYQDNSTEAREIGDLPPVYPETDIRYIDPTRREYRDFFDPETGFVVPDSTVERRFL